MIGLLFIQGVIFCCPDCMLYLKWIGIFKKWFARIRKCMLFYPLTSSFFFLYSLVLCFGWDWEVPVAGESSSHAGLARVLWHQLGYRVLKASAGQCGWRSILLLCSCFTIICSMVGFETWDWQFQLSVFDKTDLLLNIVYNRLRNCQGEKNWQGEVLDDIGYWVKGWL